MEVRSSIPVDVGGGVRKTITSRRGLVIEIDPMSALNDSILAICATISEYKCVQERLYLRIFACEGLQSHEEEVPDRLVPRKHNLVFP